jgi:GPH family glycoside/pentoside/hexuronide:cation symporter
VTLSARPLPFATLLAYGAPFLGLSALLFFVQFYFLKFATDVLLLAPAVPGMLFAAAKLYDAISNPLVGSWSDRSRSRLGRRRPFLLVALPLLVLGFAVLWSPPRGLGPGALTAWIAFGLFVFYSAFALYSVPHAALGAELSTDPHQRTRLFGVRHMSFTVGMLIAFGAIQVAMNADDPRGIAARLAVPGSLVAAALLALTPFALREPLRVGAVHGGAGLSSALGDVWRNRPARTLLVVYFIESAGVGAVGTMSPYVTEYVLGRPDLVGVLPAAYVLAGVFSIPLWVPASRRFGKRETWLAAMLAAAAAFGGMVTVGRGDEGLLIGLLVVAGCAMGCGGVLSASILTDVIDLDQARTGERKEGVYSAAMGFALKIGTSLATAASGFVLGAVGFAPNVAQSAESLMGIRVLFGALPCVGFLVGAVCFARFSLEVSPREAAAATLTAP